MEKKKNKNNDDPLSLLSKDPLNLLSKNPLSLLQKLSSLWLKR